MGVTGECSRLARRRLATRFRAGEFHPELRLLARVVPGTAVKGGRSLRFLRRLESMKKPPSDLDTRSCGPCDVVLFRPPLAQPRGLVLWIHGGGLVLGRAWDDAKGCSRLAAELGAVVVSVDYRRPPEHPFPAAIEDCYAALTWSADLPELAGRPIVIAGGSAGAGLTAALALMARDRGEVDLAAQVLVYPMLDDRTVDRADPHHGVRRLWDNEANRLGWSSYLGQQVGTHEVSAYAAAARADDLSGLPPAWIGVGTLDLFHDEDVRYAERLREAGVPCHLEVVDGAFHGFDLAARTSVARAFRASYEAAMDRALLPQT